MIGRKPEGYKDLLAYKKAGELQEQTLLLTDLFPKTFAWLKEQMDKSGRSGTKNIIEGWKRNTTPEYFTFLGYSIAAIEELKDDAADIAKGLYQPLMGIKGVMGGTGERPLSPLNPFPPFSPSPASTAPIVPLKPFTPFQLEQLRFYPLDSSLPPAVQLYLRCKEVLMLLNKLQQSLDHKMDAEMTRSPAERARKRIQQFEKENQTVLKQIENAGMIRLVNGQFISKAEYEKRIAAGESLKLWGS